MEAHPVPQNVTSFEFHLVGDMTLKQFGYLAVGLAMGYAVFLLLGGILPLIGYPMAFLFALSGVCFAFVPIGQRPLDHWLGAYFKAVFSPTQREWKKGKLNSLDQVFKNKLQFYMAQVGVKVFSDQKKAALLPNVSLGALSQRAPATQIMVNSPVPPVVSRQHITEIVTQSESTNKAGSSQVPTPQMLEDTVRLAKEAQDIQKKIVETEHELTQLKNEAAKISSDKEYTKELKGTVNELKTLTKEASNISSQLNQVTKAAPARIAPAEVKVIEPPRRVLPINFNLTSTPNVINGVVVDSQNNYLEGAIMVTHDKDGLPVRALKSNKLGQFVAATPLPNGTYTLTFEKENLVFDKIQINLDGKLVPPIMASAKRGGA